MTIKIDKQFWKDFFKNTFCKRSRYFLLFLFLYLEIVLHLYMGMKMEYAPIYVLFALSLGCICVLVTGFGRAKTNYRVTCAITIIACVVFYAEVLCKCILKQYYPLLSTWDTAANNQLDDYKSVIFQAVLQNLGALVLFLLPIVVLLVWGRKLFRFRRIHLKRKIGLLVGAVCLHLLALFMVHTDRNENLSSKMLYQSDTNIDAQVEQLGLWTMLRLDVKHSLFGTQQLMVQSQDLEALEKLQEEEKQEEEEPEIDTSPQTLDLDFSKTEGINEDVDWLNDFVKSSIPSRKNEYTGMFEGYNVIFITAEGFSGYAIDEQLTPTLYRLSQEGFVFSNYYSPLHYTSTSGGEFQNLTGLYPKNGNPISLKRTGELGTYLPFTLANALKDRGYTATGYHLNGNMYGRELSHPNLGYDWRQGEDVEMEKTESGKNIWPQSDEFLVETTIDDYVSNEPFHVYYLTISGHMPYSGGGNAMVVRNQEAVSDLPYSQETKDYLAATLELEKALASLVQRLETAGVMDHTVIALAPDHIPYFDVPVLEELAGETFGESKDIEYLNESAINFDVYKNAFILWSGSMEEPVKVDKVCTAVDILPTLLNLLGIEYDSRLLAGSDILSDSEGMVIFTSGCFMTDKGFYDQFTGTFTMNENVNLEPVEEENYIAAMKILASSRRQMTSIVIENDYYRKLLE